MANNDMKEFWNGTGGEKWLRFQKTIDENFAPFGQKALAAAAISPGEAVLDVGCGCGESTVEIAHLVGTEGRVSGLDISEPILQHARRQALSALKNNVSFECGDAQVCRFERNVYDVAFSRFGIMFFDAPVAAFKNIRGALKKGGRLAFVCWQPASENDWIRTSLEVVSRHLPLPPPPGQDDPGPLSFGDPERVKHILASSGFSNIGIKGMNVPFTVGRDLEESVAFLTQMGPASGVITQAEAGDAVKSDIAASMRKAIAAYDTGKGITMGSAIWVVSAKNI